MRCVEILHDVKSHQHHTQIWYSLSPHLKSSLNPSISIETNDSIQRKNYSKECNLDIQATVLSMIWSFLSTTASSV